MVLSMIAALALRLNSQNIVCEKLEASSKHYLERMGLFKFLGIKSGIVIKEHEAAGRFVPLTQIKNSDELSSFIADITPLLHLEPNDAEPLKYVVSELVRNVLEHSFSEYGAVVSAQYHNKSNKIRIGIADTGIGIKKSMELYHKPQNEIEALRLALTPGITGTTIREGGTEFNAGAGLFFTKSIAKVNKDFFVIYSGRAMYKLLKRTGTMIKLSADPFKDRHSIGDDFPCWQGTVVGVDLSLSQTHDFTMLLDMIREAYSKSIRDRKKEKYKKPKFI
jgi:anti-sigma regulatory factor (Ser/Thr protein kinase)